MALGLVGAGAPEQFDKEQVIEILAAALFEQNNETSWSHADPAMRHRFRCMARRLVADLTYYAYRRFD